MADEPQKPVQDQAVSNLATEQINSATIEIDRMNALEIARVINAEDAKVAEAIQQELPAIARAIDGIAAHLHKGGRLIYAGAGTSGRLGVLDAAECPPTFNVSSNLVIGLLAGGPIAQTRAQEDQEDSIEAGEAEVKALDLNANDVVVGIAASGRTPYVLGAIAYANSCGALTIGIACNASSPLEKLVQIMIAPIVGPEVITGSTRLKAGTAQKMVLNMLSTGSMILLGKTFGNLMVDVQATNYKLHQRALKIISTTTGRENEAAEELLQKAGGQVKTAILLGKTSLTPEQANEALATHGNVLRRTLDALL
ncbi:MAG TPA: N-acetylmuramic acid 6-phosphate etherase [Ktedonobacteraceae bacterium]|nr:N-acetylmuramic acid 6-phosphate etherase [Ktedonobacteraceae bacterium]